MQTASGSWARERRAPPLLSWPAPWLADQFFHKPGASDLIRLVSLALPALALTRVVIGGLQGLGLMSYSASLTRSAVRREHRSLLCRVLVLGWAPGASREAVITFWARSLIAAAFCWPARSAGLAPLSRFPAFVRPALLASADAHLDAAYSDALDRHPAPWPAGAAGEVGVYAWCSPALAGADDLDHHRTDVRAADRRRGRARRPGHAGGDAEARHLLEHLALDAGVPLLLLSRGPARAFRAAYETGARRSRSSPPASSSTLAPARWARSSTCWAAPTTMINNAAVAVLNIVGCLILIPRYGLTGAAFSTTASITLVNLIKLVQVKVDLRINPFRSSRQARRGAGLAAAALSSPAHLLWTGRDPFADPRPGSAPRALYAILFWRSCGRAEERELLRLRAPPAVAAK